MIPRQTFDKNLKKSSNLMDDTQRIGEMINGFNSRYRWIAKRW